MSINFDELSSFLAIPSISGELSYRDDMEAAVNWLCGKLNSIGFRAERMETKFNPVVYAERMVDEKKPTILIYGHYDVQSPEPLDKWESEPFKSEIRNGNLYARGVADDKGQVYCWIKGVEEALQLGEVGVNVKFLIEGGEEIGSAGLAEFVEENKDLLKADVCMISDSHSLSETQPLITYGLRGLAYMEVEVKTAEKDAHSGTYGGVIYNAIDVLTKMISALKDEKGKILIPGFYDKVRILSEEEKSELAKFPFGEAQIKEEIGALTVFGEEGFSIPVRAGARPTLDVNGIWGGYAGEGPKTVIPCVAGAKISMRLVPGQSAKEIEQKFKKYFKKIAPDGVEVKIKSISGAEAVLLEKESRFFEAAEVAFEKVFGNKPLYELAGGSIGVVADFKNILGIDSVMMGYGLPDDGLHSPNEKMSLTMIEKGIKTSKEFLMSFE